MASREHIAITNETNMSRITAALNHLATVPGLTLTPFPSADWVRLNMPGGRELSSKPDHLAMVQMGWVADTLESLAASNMPAGKAAKV